MKAAIHKKYGSAQDVLFLKEIQKPEPQDNEVLVKIFFTTVNRTDDGLIKAIPFVSRFFTGLMSPKITNLGSEFSGVIEAIGKNVSSFKIGDAVFGISADRFGAHAEYICVKEDSPIAMKPENMSFAEAAAINEGPWYALNYLEKINIQKGSKILINGTTGSIGSSALQLAKSMGAEVTAVCDAKNIALVKSLGADTVIDYTQTDFTNTNDSFNFIFDAVGKSSFYDCKKLLKENGIFFSSELGEYWANPRLAIWTHFFGKQKVIFPIPFASKKNTLFFKDLAEKGQLKAVIDRTYSLDQIVEAYKYVETGQKVGSVLIKVN